MSLKNLVLGLEPDPRLLGGTPAFRVFAIKDRNPLSQTTKRIRLLEAPNEQMRIIHGRLIRDLRALKIEQPYATACRSGDSPLKNVERHKRSEFFYLLDLRRAYQSIDIEKLAEILCRVDPELMNMHTSVQAFLEQRCMSRFGGLATGAPASPDLFNLYCAFLVDEKIGILCVEHNLTYTRYLDDLTISGNEPIRRRIRKEAREIIEQAGFGVNHGKVKLLDLAKGPITINGVGLELGGRVFVPRFYVRYLSELLKLGIQGDLSLAPKIAGSMGVFLGLTYWRTPNRTEQRLLQMYEQFCQLTKTRRRQQKKRQAV